MEIRTAPALLSSISSAIVVRPCNLCGPEKIEDDSQSCKKAILARPQNFQKLDIYKLKEVIYQVHPLSDNEWEDVSRIWLPVTYKRKTLLTAAGEVEKHLYFVLAGVQRSFYLDESHPESTIVFTYPFSFSGVADSFLTQTPSRYFFETLTSSEMLRTSYHQISELMDKYHNVERWVRKATSFALIGTLERQVELMSFTAEEKFRTLLKRSPHVLQMIPHKYLASYLGLDPSTFSKLMSTVRID